MNFIDATAATMLFSVEDWLSIMFICKYIPSRHCFFRWLHCNSTQLQMCKYMCTSGSERCGGIQACHGLYQPRLYSQWWVFFFTTYQWLILPQRLITVLIKILGCLDIAGCSCFCMYIYCLHVPMSWNQLYIFRKKILWGSRKLIMISTERKSNHLVVAMNSG